MRMAVGPEAVLRFENVHHSSHQSFSSGAASCFSTLGDRGWAGYKSKQLFSLQCIKASTKTSTQSSLRQVIQLQFSSSTYLLYLCQGGLLIPRTLAKGQDRKYEAYLKPKSLANASSSFSLHALRVEGSCPRTCAALRRILSTWK
jgi:hypothetical protein